MSPPAVVRRDLAPLGLVGGTLIAAGLAGSAAWLLSRRAQPDIDARTKARLLPFGQRSGR